MQRLDPTRHRDACQVAPTQQGGPQLDLRHHHLHAVVGVVDRHHAGDGEASAAGFDAEFFSAQPQRRGGAQAMAKLQHYQGEAQQQGQHQQELEQNQCGKR